MNYLKFNAVSTKTPIEFFMKCDRPFIKFIWKNESLKVSRQFWRGCGGELALADTKLSGESCFRKKIMTQWNRIDGLLKISVWWQK